MAGMRPAISNEQASAPASARDRQRSEDARAVHPPVQDGAASLWMAVICFAVAGVCGLCLLLLR